MLEQVFDALSRDDRLRIFLTLDHFWARLAMHIRAEHLHLFPILLQKAAESNLLEATGDILSRLPYTISLLRRDHDCFVKEIGKDVNRLREQGREMVEPATVDLGEIQRNLLTVAQRLEVHNELEENEVYPLAQVLLTSEEIAGLTDSIRAELANFPLRFRGHSHSD